MMQDFGDAFLNSMRQQGDPVADEFVSRCFSNPSVTPNLYAFIDPGEPAPNPDEFAQIFPDGKALARTVKMPDWANPHSMELGSTLYVRYPETIMSLLGLLSLPYCYAAADGAAVLFKSERMRNNTTVRLYQTALFVWKMMKPGAFQSDGEAIAEILKVRITHAVVRYHVGKQNWDLKLGAPINQEDMAGTNLAFSLVVLRGLKQFGLKVKPEEASGFLHLWRVIGYLSGIDERLLTDSAEVAHQLDDAINRRHFKKSAHGVQLTTSLIDHIYRVNNEKVARRDIAALLRHLLGTNISNLLGIPDHRLPKAKWFVIRSLQQFKGIWLLASPTSRYADAYKRFLKAGILDKQ